VIAASYLSHDVNTIIWALTFYSQRDSCSRFVYTNARYKLSFRGVSWQSIREQAHFAVPVGLAGIALILVSQTDKFIISRYMGREAFAIYSVGAFQVPLANVIQTSIGNVTFPLISKYQKAGNLAAMADLWRRATIKRDVVLPDVRVSRADRAALHHDPVHREVCAPRPGVHDLHAALPPFLGGDGRHHPGVQPHGFVMACFFVGFA
jgi:hypothetical protein